MRPWTLAPLTGATPRATGCRGTAVPSRGPWSRRHSLSVRPPTRTFGLVSAFTGPGPRACAGFAVRTRFLPWGAGRISGSAGPASRGTQGPCPAPGSQRRGATSSCFSPPRAPARSGPLPSSSRSAGGGSSSGFPRPATRSIFPCVLLPSAQPLGSRVSSRALPVCKLCCCLHVELGELLCAPHASPFRTCALQTFSAELQLLLSFS